MHTSDMTTKSKSKEMGLNILSILILVLPDILFLINKKSKFKKLFFLASTLMFKKKMGLQNNFNKNIGPRAYNKVILFNFDLRKKKRFWF
jgi:hypothetical protein